MRQSDTTNSFDGSISGLPCVGDQPGGVPTALSDSQPTRFLTGELKPLPANFFSLLVWAKKEGYKLEEYWMFRFPERHGILNNWSSQGFLEALAKIQQECGLLANLRAQVASRLFECHTFYRTAHFIIHLDRLQGILSAEGQELAVFDLPLTEDQKMLIHSTKASS